ncbi:hypothetical protein O163_13800 [Caldanaerobacter subterraneus subsp. yonseiensis KB-1]|uniref:Uncharacterized protein n=1 Tax=Caldanaerobacter subterraneus subsp. yonseiensis KB-1 TaxID=1388761 RepID=U5CLI1_CALSX|nr:hypothetical protein O163_13800 [Caldanaerobacter subterraneus subsp. yonseiensis KB-1]
MDSTGIILGAITWIPICILECKQEEKQLYQLFKEDYLKYSNKTSLAFSKLKLNFPRFNFLT